MLRPNMSPVKDMPEGGSKFRATTLAFDADTHTALRQQALDASAEEGRVVTMAEVVRRAVASYLDLPLPPSPRRGRPPKGTDLVVRRGENVTLYQAKRPRPPKKG